MTATNTKTDKKLSLPDDLAQCHALIEELQATLQATMQEHEREKAHLQHRVAYLIEQMYGRRAEKVDPAQLLLFAEQVAQTVQPETTADEIEEPPPPQRKKKKSGRKKLPVELPRIQIKHPVPEDKEICQHCSSPCRCIGHKITEQLEYAPASLFIIEHIQPVMGCRCGEGEIVVAQKPAQPIEKGIPGPGLLAQVVVSKYADHLPLYRQENMFQRHGVEISRKTMCDWVLAAAQMLEPVVDFMKTKLLESKVIHTDDTPVNVRGPDGNMQGRFWVYLGDEEHPYTIFDFTPDRRRDGPQTFLADFVGSAASPRYLQADAYGGYDGIFSAGNAVLECACWAHARRRFYEARKSDVNRAHQMLAWIKLLYAVERDARELDAAQRYAMRQERSRPILYKISTWLDEQKDIVLPKSPIGEAIGYCINQWQALNRYLDDGDLSMDNNVSENALRGIAIGRKNYLFIGSLRGGHAAAILYTMIKCAQRHNIDVFVYLRDLFMRIPTHPNKDIQQLLPDNWKRDILPNLQPPPRP